MLWNWPKLVVNFQNVFQKSRLSILLWENNFFKILLPPYFWTKMRGGNLTASNLFCLGWALFLKCLTILLQNLMSVLGWTLKQKNDTKNLIISFLLKFESLYNEPLPLKKKEENLLLSTKMITWQVISWFWK